MIDGNSGRLTMRRNGLRAATRPLTRDGVERLVNSAIHDLRVLRKDLTPEAVRGYVETNIRIESSLGSYLHPRKEDLDEALELSRLEILCARQADPVTDEPDDDGPSIIRP